MFLFLDEPTNHLDIYAKDELARALREFKGTIVLVSHEPEFYEGWVTDIWNIEDWTTKIVQEAYESTCKRKVQNSFNCALSVDTKAPELEKTPTRVTELYEELFSGVGKETKELWGELFSTDYNGLVAVTDIPFYSMCEHHLLPFFGTVDVIYQPHSGCVAGLSKFNDVITVFKQKATITGTLDSRNRLMLQNVIYQQKVFLYVLKQHNYVC